MTISSCNAVTNIRNSYQRKEMVYMTMYLHEKGAKDFYFDYHNFQIIIFTLYNCCILQFSIIIITIEI